MSVAASVEVRWDRVDLLDLNRKGEGFYQVQDSDLYCRMCPAGKTASNIPKQHPSTRLWQQNQLWLQRHPLPVLYNR